MTGKGRTTLAARIAAVQTRVTVIALALVTLGTAIAVSVTLSRKTDQQLICDVIRALAESLRTTHPEKRFVLALPDEALVQAEEPLIARALGNLFDNAIKYGDESAIEVRVERTPDSVKVSVVNGGTGIRTARAHECSFRSFARKKLLRTPKASALGCHLLGRWLVRMAATSSSLAKTWTRRSWCCNCRSLAGAKR